MIKTMKIGIPCVSPILLRDLDLFLCCDYLGGGAKGLFWTESRFELNVTFSYDSEVSVFIKYFQYTETTETSESHNSVF